MVPRSSLPVQWLVHTMGCRLKPEVGARPSARLTKVARWGALLQRILIEADQSSRAGIVPFMGRRAPTGDLIEAAAVARWHWPLYAEARSYKIG